MASKQFRPKYVKRIFVQEKEIEAAITKAAKWIEKNYKNCKKPPILISILKGAVPFYCKTAMNIHMDVEFDFIVLSSFRGQMKALTAPKIVTDLCSDIHGRDVIVLEDVIDTARTLKVLIDYLKLRKPHSIKTMCLVDKPDKRMVKFKVDYSCFSIKGDPFLIGYGLDIKELARNLPYIAEFDKKYLNKI